MLAVQKDGKPYATLRPSRNYYAGVGSQSGAGPIRGFFEGEATSEVGRRTTAGGDFWTAMQPDLAPLDPIINEADRRLGRIARRLPPGRRPGGASAQLPSGCGDPLIRERYVEGPAPGELPGQRQPAGQLAVGWRRDCRARRPGGDWPAPDARRRRVSDVYAARLARELGRA